MHSMLFITLFTYDVRSKLRSTPKILDDPRVIIGQRIKPADTFFYIEISTC